MNRKLGLTVVSLALLASCDDESCFTGTCDGAGGTGGPGVGAGGTIVLTEDNFVAALREAWFAMEVASGVPAFVVETGIGDTSGGVASLGGPSAKAMRSVVAVDPFGPTVYNCPVSGTFTVSGDIADPNTVTPGDFAIYDSSACDSGTGYTVDGNHRLDIDTVDGDVNSGMYAQGQTLNFDGFRAQGATFTVELNGDHSSLVDTQSGSSVDTTFSGGSLIVDESQITVSITNFIGADSVNTSSPFLRTINVDGNAASTAAPGSFRFATMETVLWESGAYPHDGILQVFGASPGTARVAVVDNQFCNLQLDANGNTNHETTIQMSWAEFLGLSH